MLEVIWGAIGKLDLPIQIAAQSELWIVFRWQMNPLASARLA
jgi:hypothetical protein